jgi:nucleotide-binding universal stress UspA family protein
MMFKHILAPHDGSELSQRSTAAAVNFARSIGAKVTSFYAQEQPQPADFRFNSNPLPPEAFRADEEERAKAIAAEVEAMAKAAGVSCVCATATAGAPFEAIIRSAKDNGCDLIFMASHGRKGLSALVIGSETYKVLTHCTIPVMVYR